MSIRPGNRVAVVGDVGGHRDALVAELTRLGADPGTGELPDDLTVIQVGDLVHRGPDSEGVVALVDRYLDRQPDQWIQLVGNHEAQYLRDPVFDWPERIDEAAADTLRDWWASGRMQVAVAVETPHTGFLVTHAGLTADYWRDVLDAPEDVHRVAEGLNELVVRGDDVLFRAGEMLGNGRPTTSAGPLWASAPTELVPSWIATRLPFSQVHGHTSIFDWQNHRHRGSAEVTRRTTVDERAKHEITVLDGGLIIGIDPGHGRCAHHPWRSWEARM